MTGTLGLLRAIDALYRSVVVAPGEWHEQAFADWAADATAAGVDKAQARAVRRSLRMAQKLRDFWANDEAAVTAPDWRTRVDVALGPRAWRPTLELAQHGLDTAPSAELFLEVRERFRVVNSEDWLDGIDYDAWMLRREQDGC